MLARKNKAVLICYIVAMVLFLAYLFNANQIVAYCLGENRAFQPDNFEKYQSNSTVTYFWTGLQMNEDFFQTLTVSGIFFCETSLPVEREEQRARLILHSDQGTYSTELNLVSRKDVYLKLTNFSHIPNEKLLVTSQSISTVALPDGIYDAHIYVEESEEVFGICDMGLKFEKDTNGLHIVASPVETEWDSIQTKNMVQDLNFTNLGNGYQVMCYSFIQDIDLKNQTYYLEVDNGREVQEYRCTNYFSDDIGLYYGNQDYNQTRFLSFIPQEILIPEQSFSVTVIIQNGDGQIYKGEPMSFQVNPETNAVEKILPLNLPQDAIAEYADGHVLGNIEQCVASDNALRIAGWTVLEGVEAQQSQVYLEFVDADGQVFVYDTKKVERPDVAQFYENDLYLSSGFQCAIPRSAFTSNVIQVRAVIQYNHQYYAGDYYSFEL